jgi:hypothetical protein
VKARYLLLAPTMLVVTAALHLRVGREPRLTWGATHDEVNRLMPGDDLMADPQVLATRAITIDAPPASIWPWLMQMGSGRGGVYTYDWIENVFGLSMHSSSVVHPEWQDRRIGDAEQLGKSGPILRIELLEPKSAMVFASEDGDWIWAFGLYPIDQSQTRLVSRNRIRSSEASLVRRAFQTSVMEPGSLVMERKMLLGIKELAEALVTASQWDVGRAA